MKSVGEQKESWLRVRTVMIQRLDFWFDFFPDVSDRSYEMTLLNSCSGG